MSETTNENVMTVKSSNFEKIMTGTSVGAIILIPVIAFYCISSEFKTNNTMSRDSIEQSERMHDEDVKRAERIHNERIKMHKEYLDTIKASTSNIVEAIKSMKK